MERIGRLHLSKNEHSSATNLNKQIIFGCNEKTLLHLNVIYLLAKQYIYKCRCRETFPTIQQYILQLGNLLEIEKYTYTLKGQYTIYLVRWGELAK
jgi:DNA polymerase I-like protein with 3'-5' exonuclease and polymerase domains